MPNLKILKEIFLNMNSTFLEYLIFKRDAILWWSTIFHSYETMANMQILWATYRPLSSKCDKLTVAHHLILQYITKKNMEKQMNKKKKPENY
jgi:hypothetical protein